MKYIMILVVLFIIIHQGREISDLKVRLEAAHDAYEQCTLGNEEF